MASVKLWYGPAGSGRAGLIDRTMLDHWGRATLIVPSREHARRRAESLLAQSGQPGIWDRPVVTFQDFAARLIRQSRFEGDRLSPLEQRILLDRALASVGKSGGLAAVGRSAETEGFLSHVQQAITRLKQAAVDPAEFRERAMRRARPSNLDAVVADIYAEYQKLLLENGALDLPGLYWVAALHCQETRPACLAEIDAVLLDGFDDFTSSEYRLIEAVVPHVEFAGFGLNYDADPRRRDLYETVRRTAERLALRFSPVVESVEPVPPRTTTEFAAANLFLRDEPATRDGLVENIGLIECHTPVHEVETIARRIKGLIVEQGAAPGSIAILLRSHGDEGDSIRTVFREFGIPLQMENRPALNTVAAPRAALALLSALDGWRRDDVLDLLTGPPFGAPDKAAHQAFAALARHARIVGGSKQWEYRIERLQTRLLENDVADTRRVRRELDDPAGACDALRAALEQLKEVATCLPSTATIAYHAEAIDGVVAGWALPGIDALRGVLGDMHRWDSVKPETVPRRAFARRLRQALAASEADDDSADGGVWCIQIESARHLNFDYVFLAAANEGNLPKPPTRNALFSDSDVEQLREAGIGIDGVEVHSRREALLFQRVFEVPLKGLFITRHTIARNEQEKLESPFVADLHRLLPQIAWIPDASVHVPLPSQAACPRDLRNAAFSGSAELKIWFPVEMACAVPGAIVEAERHGDGPFGSHDGVLGDGELIAAVARKFGPDHVFSVQQIETYISCPFRFFLERVLELATAEIDDDGFDPMVRGTILHEALETFHRLHAGVPFSDLQIDLVTPALSGAIDRAFERHAWKSANTPDGVIRVESARMKVSLGRYLKIERERKNELPWQPTYFETAFGRAGEPSAGPISAPEAFSLDTDAGPVLLAGRIDRIDLLDSAARIIDYKSSVLPKAGDVANGTSLQLMIYAMAVENHLMKGAQCAEALFIRPGIEETREALGRESKKANFEERQKNCLRVLAESVKGIRAGRFHPATGKEACSFCPSHNICRRESARMERKASDG